MKTIARRLAIVTTLLLLVTPVRSQQEPTDAHDFGCVTCHSTHRPRGPSLFPSPVPEQTTEGTPLYGHEGMCYACHKAEEKGGTFFEPGMSHPVNVSPPEGMVVPPELGTTLVRGLGEVITCTSCHDAHGKNRGFLKIPLQQDQLCVACHQGF